MDRLRGRFLPPRDAAHVYVDRGWHVVPANGKRPAISWRDGGLSTHEDVDREWDRRPDANVAIVTGSSGLVVIDFDRDDWRAALRSLERALGPLDYALAITGSGGAHLYTRHPEGEPIATRAPMRINGAELHGIDVRAVGGIVIAPGSTHPATGAAYEWAPWGSIPPDEIPALPASWHEALTWTPPVQREPVVIPTGGDRARRYAVAALEAECRDVASAPKGTRNERLHRAAVALGGYVPTITATEIARALEGACSAWERRDTRKDADTIARGIEYGAAHPRALGERTAA